MLNGVKFKPHRINIDKWKEFRIGDVFNIQKGKRLTKAQQLPGGTPFIGASAENHGITGYIGQKPIFEGNTITVSYNGSVGQVFYQEQPYWASDDINVLSLKEGHLTILTGLFLGACLQKVGQSFAYTDKWTVEKMQRTKIKLPVSANGDIDWLSMKRFVSQIATLSNRNVKSLNVEDIPVFIGPWKSFKIGDIFDIANSATNLKRDVVFDSGNTPYVTASDENNGVASLVNAERLSIENAPALFVGGKTFSVTFQAKPFVSNDSHNLVLTFRDKYHVNVLTYLYFIGIIKCFGSSKFTWADAVNKSKMKNGKIKLPVNSNGQPDFDYMTQYIKMIQKRAKNNIRAVQNIANY